MRYIVIFDHHDDLLVFSRVLSNVNRHIDFTVEYDELTAAWFSDKTGEPEADRLCSATLDVVPASDRFVTLRHMGSGLVVVTVRNNSGHILLETNVHTSEARKPTEMRAKLSAMAIALSQGNQSLSGWKLVAMKFEVDYHQGLLPALQNIEGQTGAARIAHSTYVNELPNSVTISCPDCLEQGRIECEYGDWKCAKCNRYLSLN